MESNTATIRIQRDGEAPVLIGTIGDAGNIQWSDTVTIDDLKFALSSQYSAMNGIISKQVVEHDRLMHGLDRISAALKGDAHAPRAVV